MVRISDLSAARLAAFDKHIALLDSLVPELAPKAGAAFALVAFARQRNVLRALTPNRQEQVWLDRVAEIEQEWWRWCTGESSTFPSIAVEAERVAVAVEPHLVYPLREVLLNGAALFAALEQGDYAHGKYSAMRNFSVIELLEEYLPEATVDQLVFREIERQEQELLLLADGVDSQTRDKLAAVSSPSEMLGEYLTLVPLETLPESW